MRKITIFYLADCPYCHSAQKALEELRAEKTEYCEIEAEWIEESRQPDLSKQYDYYYVPSIFSGDKKLYEADPSEDYASIKENVREALEAVL